MSNDDDECDSTVASQADVNSFLQAQSAKNTGNVLSNSDDESETTDQQSSVRRRSSKNYLSQSCFASISTKATNADDLTELKWLNNFQLKDYLSQTAWKEKVSDGNALHHDRMNQLIQQLKTVRFDASPMDLNTESIAIGLFLGFYSKRDDPETPWALTTKQCYEYFQANMKSIVDQRHWKHLVRQTLITLPCFVQKKDETVKTRLLWTIDSYYRPLLTRAYTSNLASMEKKTLTEVSNHRTDERSASPPVIDHYPPKATIQKAALPRLFERLREQSRLFPTEQTERKRARSASLLESFHKHDDNERQMSSSTPWKKRGKTTSSKIATASVVQQRSDAESTRTQNEEMVITPQPSLDHSYTHQNHSETKITDDERDSDHRAQSKSSSNRKVRAKKQRSTLVLTRTRMSRRIIEQDLKLLREAQHPSQPLDLSRNILQ